MTIYCVGSINADHFYDVPHIPAPGETLAGANFRIGLGGKGANQSVAAAKAGAEVVHIGAVGADGAWAVERLSALGVGTDHILTVEEPTAHAIINVAADGENAIVIYSGANLCQSEDEIAAALKSAKPGDRLILQNEASLQVEAAQMAKAAGLEVIYSAAPFSTEAVEAILPHTDILVVNDVEAAQLSESLNVDVADLPVKGMLVTRGADGADFIAPGDVTHVDAHQVTPVDTTGAGDTFLGYFVAGLDQGMSVADAMGLASAAGALKVTRPGTADAIPSRKDVEAFRA
ncbi:MAG: ribokinase [Rhodobacteraceae bacterium]|nr:ribokinase [Paracoccaceae bacterium]